MVSSTAPAVSRAGVRRAGASGAGASTRPLPVCVLTSATASFVPEAGAHGLAKSRCATR